MDEKKISIIFSRLSLESNDQPGEAAVLWGAGPFEQDPFGEISQLQVQAAAQENLHHRRQEAAHWRVQADDAVTASGDEAVLCRVSTTGTSGCMGGLKESCSESFVLKIKKMFKVTQFEWLRNVSCTACNGITRICFTRCNSTETACPITALRTMLEGESSAHL